MEKKKKEIHDKSYSWQVSYIFEIKDETYFKQLVQDQEERDRDLQQQKIEEEKQKELENKVKMLDDF